MYNMKSWVDIVSTLLSPLKVPTLPPSLPWPFFPLPTPYSLPLLFHYPSLPSTSLWGAEEEVVQKSKQGCTLRGHGEGDRLEKYFEIGRNGGILMWCKGFGGVRFRSGWKKMSKVVEMAPKMPRRVWLGLWCGLWFGTVPGSSLRT